LFVDVRYPGEFEGLGHLPGAVNVPARKLTTPELEVALRALPRKPVVIPCYDRRSSFYASIIGLKLSRMGTSSSGATPRPRASRSRQGQAARRGLEGAPRGGHAAGERAGAAGDQHEGRLGRLGSLALAIALLVLALRLLVLPLTLKADRDRWCRRASRRG
jgi:hypothetical protein